MPNPLFNALGGGPNPMMARFEQFMNMMRGQDPDRLIQQMVASGRVTQQQLDQVQKRARQMEDTFSSLRGKLGF